MSEDERRDVECRWTWDNGVWATSCGNLFDLDAGSPKENDMKFCCYCGKPLEESWGE